MNEMAGGGSGPFYGEPHGFNNQNYGMVHQSFGGGGSNYSGAP